MTGLPVRTEAAVIVGRVLRHGGYSNVLVDNAGRGVSPRHRAHLRGLVFGTLRGLQRIDTTIAAVSNRPLDRIQPAVLDVIRVGVAELVRATAEPYAVVSEAVESVRAIGKPKAAGFVNATLRRVAAARDSGELGDDDWATLPGWIIGELEQAWGAAAAQSFLTSSEAPDVGIRVRPGTTVDVGVPGEGIPGSRLVSAEDLGVLEPLIAAGGVLVSDPASTAVALAVGAAPQEHVLDAAAAPGGKTSALWDAMGGEGVLVAADRNVRRLDRMERRMIRHGIHPEYVAADAVAPPFRPRSFDRILLDAPCSGLGTWRRRPEIPLHLDPNDPSRLGELQRRMIDALLPLLRRGGSLVYSVCTVFAAETIDVVAPYPAAPPQGLPGRVWGKGILLGPHLTGTDGMYIATITP